MQKSLAIVKYPQRILLKKAHPVPFPIPDLKPLLEGMKKAMELHKGIGLAAPQIGDSKQIIVVKGQRKNYAFLNPKILKKSRKQMVDEEGCLSLPGIFCKVKRPYGVEVVAQTPQGKPIRIAAKGLSARIFQHEIDHLQGILIIHRVNPVKRLWDSLKS